MNAISRASDSAEQAARESQRAATGASEPGKPPPSVRAERDWAMSAEQANRARGVAEEQRRLASEAVTARQLAQREAERQQALTVEATANRGSPNSRAMRSSSPAAP